MPQPFPPTEIHAMNLLPVVASLLLCAVASSQNGPPLFPAGQPALAAIRPELQNTLPPPIVQVFGNPALIVHSAVLTPIVPAGSPMFTLIGVPIAAALPLGAPPLFAGYGLPGHLQMSNILVVSPGVAGTFGSPPYTLSIPPGLGPIGRVLSAQIAVFVPGGIGLTGAIGIDI